MLGSEPDDSDTSRIEIDESKIIGNANTVIWIFGLIDRVDKQARVYCVMNDRTKNTLLNIVKNNIYTPVQFVMKILKLGFIAIVFHHTKLVILQL